MSDQPTTPDESPEPFDWEALQATAEPHDPEAQQQREDAKPNREGLSPGMRYLTKRREPIRHQPED